MNIDQIVDIVPAGVEPEHLRPAPEKLLSGDPLQTVHPSYSSADGRFSAGIWESEPGCWKVHYTEYEYCEILEGESVLRDPDDHPKFLRPGDRFVIPAGFRGTWEVLRRCRKVYVVFEPTAATDC